MTVVMTVCFLSLLLEIDNKTKSSEQFLVSYINNFLSFLLVVPVSAIFFP